MSAWSFIKDQLRGKTAWRDGRKREPWSGEIIDEGPPIESKSVHDEDRAWKGESGQLSGLEPVPDPENPHGGFVPGKYGIPLTGMPPISLGLRFPETVEEAVLGVQPGEEIYNRHNRPAQFHQGRTVWVASKTYGHFLARVEEPVKIGNEWFYDVSDSLLHVAYEPPAHVKHLIVHESALEPYRVSLGGDRAPQPPTGSAEAAAAAYMSGIWGPDGGWAFSNPPTSLESLKRYAEERGKEWTSPAVQTQFMVEHFGALGGLMVVPSHDAYKAARKAQASGQAKSAEDQRSDVLTTPEIKRNYYLSMIQAWKELGNENMVENLRDELLSMWHADVFPGKSVYWVLNLTEAQYDAWVEKKEGK